MSFNRHQKKEGQNDLPEFISNTIKLYADDTKLLSKANGSNNPHANRVDIY